MTPTQRTLIEDYMHAVSECGLNQAAGAGVMARLAKAERVLMDALEQPAVEPVHPRHPFVAHWINSGIEACAGIAEAYGNTDAARDMRGLVTTAPQAQPAVEQQLMRLLASAWFYGGWKAETNNEKDMETLMVAAGWWPFKDEAALLAKIAAPQAQPAPVHGPVTDEENERFSQDVSNFSGADPEATKYALEAFLRRRAPAQQPTPVQEKS